MAAGIVSSILVVLRRFIAGLARHRSQRIRLVGLMIASCIVPTAAMVSVMGEVVGTNGEQVVRIIIDVQTMKIVTAYPV